MRRLSACKMVLAVFLQVVAPHCETVLGLLKNVALVGRNIGLRVKLLVIAAQKGVSQENMFPPWNLQRMSAEAVICVRKPHGPVCLVYLCSLAIARNRVVCRCQGSRCLLSGGRLKLFPQRSEFQHQLVLELFQTSSSVPGIHEPQAHGKELNYQPHLQCSGHS